MADPLLQTKLYIPRAQPSLVSRPRLMARLNQGLRGRLNLLSAPAGYGKTTLLAEWIRQIDNPTTWLSLDEGDNDPNRFLNYLIAAMQRIDGNIGGSALSILNSPRPAGTEAVLTTLINDISISDRGNGISGTASRMQYSQSRMSEGSLDTSRRRLILILDDYHVIEAEPIHEGLSFLMDHMPENLHLVIATRADPPLPLARLRARGQLMELRQNDLRFSAKESATFLNSVMALDLMSEEVAILEARTEGWIAGLQMAAISLQGQQASTRYVRSDLVSGFAGSHRYILDYLVEEVLEQQPAIIQEFLLKTSILERLTGSLCDAVMAEPRTGKNEWFLEAETSHFSDSQSILTHLEDANLFIVPQDHERRWYRYHRLFSDLLQKRLQQRYSDSLAALHDRASIWFEQQGLMSSAIEHALSAQNTERAGILIEKGVEATLMRSQVVTFLNWMDRLPDQWVSNHPTLCFYHAWALLLGGRSLAAVEQRLQDIASIQDATESNHVMTGRIAALRAYLMLFKADMSRAAELCQQALEYLPESDRFLRSTVVWILSLARLTGGDLQQGAQALQEVARLGEEIGNPLIAVAALCHQAKLLMRQGRLYRAQEILEQALQLATDPQERRLPIASEALIGLGQLHLEWNQLEEAVVNLNESIELAGQWSEMAAFDAYFPLARVRLALGDVVGAHEALESARQIADHSEATKLDDLVAELQMAYFFAKSGENTRVRRWAQRRDLIRDDFSVIIPVFDEDQDYISARLRKYEFLVLARWLNSQDRTEEALELLDILLSEAKRLGRIDLTIQIQIQRALSFQNGGHIGPAMATLAETLTLAETGGYLRIFLDEGEPLAALIDRVAAQGITSTYTANLIAVFREQKPEEAKEGSLSPGSQTLIEPLTERELEVLRLLATGMSNREIARELYIAVSTVRSHCKSIYGKLDVHRRWDAVVRAQELGLV